MQYSVKDFLNNDVSIFVKENNDKAEKMPQNKQNKETNKELNNTDSVNEQTEETLNNQNQINQNKEMPQNKQNINEDNNYLKSRELELMRKTYSLINKILYPFVLEVLDEFEFLGSPIYGINGVDKETLSQLIDRVINLSEESLDQVGEAKNERTGNYLRQWDRWGLLRAAVESLLLNDIFAIRRPNYYKKYAPNILK